MSLRLPGALSAWLDSEAARLGVSRRQVILRILADAQARAGTLGA
jgi:hypothetical protein